MARATEKRIARKRRHLRVRKKVSGNAEIPRLNVYRSLKHIYAQLIDDHSGRTLVFASIGSLQGQLTTPKSSSARWWGASCQRNLRYRVSCICAEDLLEK